MASVVDVIPIVHVIDVNVVGFVPGARPGFRPWIDHAEPEARVLEPGVSIQLDDWKVVHAKPACAAKIRTETVFRDAVASVAPAFTPAVVLASPMLRTLTLPDVSRSEVLFLFVPVCLPHGLRPACLRVTGLLPFRPVLLCPLLLVGTLFASLRPIRLPSVRVLLGS